MPRKNLTKERTEQILDAFERCVARYGLGGTSLEQVAQEAGVRRSILRHYIGNRDDLVRAMTERFVGRYRGQWAEMAEYIGTEQRVERLLDCLFQPATPEVVADILLAEALIAAAETSGEIRAHMTAMVEESVAAVQAQLQAAFPGAAENDVWTVAYGVVGIYFNQESLAPLALPTSYGQAARAAARKLIETLGD